MLFDSLSYLVFLPIVFFVYWFACRTTRVQNVFLCIASFFFYSCWDYRFLFLLIISIAVNYLTGIIISNNEKKRFRLIVLWAAIIVNVGILGFFKYYNFFVGSASELLESLGFTPHLTTLKIILPVGISFYTFHGLSYIIDIYYRKITPTKNIVDYSLFVSFFTLLVAGPIERATHLLPQIQNKRNFSYVKAADGLKQILWGLFKKMVIADNCAVVVDNIYANYDTVGSMSLVVAAILFSVQIYCDFSGYSDIALGSSRLFGFELLHNFNFPYFSRNIAEFWRRWHISLTSWFKDYIYIPLGGSRKGKTKQVLNTIVIFLISGFWHGANWTFILWGAINALLIIPSILFKTNRTTLGVVAFGKIAPSLKEAFQVITTFALATFAWIIFRSDTITDAIAYVGRMISFQDMSSRLHYTGFIKLPQLSIIIIAMFVVEWFARDKKHGLQTFLPNVPRWIRIVFYYVIIMLILSLKTAESQQFIYFQF